MNFILNALIRFWSGPPTDQDTEDLGFKALLARDHPDLVNEAQKKGLGTIFKPYE
jgi:hypothetical protein